MWYLRSAFFFFSQRPMRRRELGFPGLDSQGLAALTPPTLPACWRVPCMLGLETTGDPLRSTLCPPHTPTAVWEGGKHGQASLGLSVGSLLQAQLHPRCVEPLTEESRQLQGDPSRGFLLSPLPQGLQCSRLLQPCSQGPGPTWG